jgi:trehalose 6-phosphate phosphatase
MISPSNSRKPVSLFLDVDGTLVEFAPHPDKVVVARPLVSLLGELYSATSSALALVSGRAIESIDRLFDPFRGSAVGLHGIEFRHPPSAALERIPVDPVPLVLVQAAQQALSSYGAAFIEDKGFAVAIHHRLDAARTEAMRLDLANACASYGNGWMVMAGRQVLEIKPAGVNKGHGIDRLMSMAPFAGTVPIAFGDDVTDLDMFEAVHRHGGINVSVGPRISGAGDLHLPSPRSSAAMLTDIGRILSQSNHAGNILQVMCAGDERRAG